MAKYYCELCFDTVTKDDYYGWYNMYLCSNCEQELLELDDRLHDLCDDDDDDYENEYMD